jgi:putative FmdB family regulatory protein
MPMYEYVCMKCEAHFEELVRGEQQVLCPQCGATKVEAALDVRDDRHGRSDRRVRRRLLRRQLRLRAVT